ncbi:hypothetical protein O4G76_09025 [Limimaricola sp. G21655-S1]|uniref:hypothetical protein n=1 Tax=Limimaricola sp. G21655-S1 TaxID=3014768 RepID=UPI0022AFFEB2|nr:hypothetical protein [Limimaricola sp. G21655-S1]MCZ4260977.1 hypothetical protein [Limimaricola sp. G21655-S1]
MSVVLFPTMLRLPLPNPDEALSIYPDGDAVEVNGFNFQRGFGWHVGRFPDWGSAMGGARAHWLEEAEMLGGAA